MPYLGWFSTMPWRLSHTAPALRHSESFLIFQENLSHFSYFWSSKTIALLLYTKTIPMSSAKNGFSFSNRSICNAQKPCLQFFPSVLGLPFQSTSPSTLHTISYKLTLTCGWKKCDFIIWTWSFIRFPYSLPMGSLYNWDFMYL